MSFIDLLLANPVLEKMVPDRYRQLDDQIIYDQATISLIQRTEQLLDEMIEQPSSVLRYRKTFTKHSTEFQITLKINRKKIWLHFADTHRSSASIKKRIIIECYRKYVKEKEGQGKCTMYFIWYRINGRTQMRSVRKSPLFQSIFYKINLLDDTLLNKLIDPNKKVELPTQGVPLLPQKNGMQKDDLLVEVQRFVQHQKHHLKIEKVIEDRIESLVIQLKQIAPDFQLLDIEERHVLKRMVRQDLPSLIHTYVILSQKDQEKHKENLFLTLSKMELKVLQLLKNIESSKEKRMEYLLKLNDMRYRR
ncbi:hypothetical protein [Caldalkalibacillus mannanilyticus]|uniref:hypothetical protein n=1 Tax=Caldalkalibacillus mannanilyticus TaxID=1418 RepID=UPI00046A37D4|nr:hypothetical protein [Caldalkalibacillus mannanilyticus]